MRIAVLVKQVPKFEEMQLDENGRLRRDGIELEMNPYCRRAVNQACEFAAMRAGTTVTVFTLGPPAAEDTLREALAWGIARGVAIDAVHVSDPAFAGSDTLATAQALGAALRREGPFDLVLTGRNSVDADTGQVGPELAELLELPFMTGVRHCNLDGDRLAVRCEHDDGWLQAEVPLPAVLSCAERLTEPAKVDPPGRAAVPADLIRRVSAAALGAGPWGQDASPTWVGPVKVMAVTRTRTRWPDAALDEQVERALRVLHERGALDGAAPVTADIVPEPAPEDDRVVAVVVEPGRAHATRELLGTAALLGDRVVACTIDAPDSDELGTWGADAVVHLTGSRVEADIANAFARWAARHQPWAVLACSTAWGREVAARAAARLHAGLTGDAVDLEVENGRLVAWKPAFGGQLVAAIGCSSPIQMATVRAGVLPTLLARPTRPVAVDSVDVPARSPVKVLARTREDDIEILADAQVVIGVGQGVPPNEYRLIEPLRTALGAELGATRKVTDMGWLPRARQIGITGRAIAPRLFVSVGASGKFNHTVGIRAAATVLAINPDAAAPIFDAADVGIVGDWREVVPRLVTALGGPR